MSRNRKILKKLTLSEIFKYRVREPGPVNLLELDNLPFLPKFKRGRGRPRKPRTEKGEIKRPKGRPRKKPIVEKEYVNPVGRPRIHPTEEELKAAKQEEEAKKREERIRFRRLGRR